MRTARTLSVLTGLLLVLGTVSAGAPATAGSPTGSYIVVFEPGVSDVAVEATALARAHGGQVGFIYEHALQGFSITTSPRAAAAIARSPRVAYVEVDSEVSIAAEITPQETPTGVERIFADDNGAIDIDGVDDQRVDVDVAVIDTGVDFEHPDLNVYTEGSVNCAGGSLFRSRCSSGGDDDHYHGTHVAGSIGALDNSIGVVGVAPGARIWAIKVLNSNGSGYTSWIVAGIDYVAANAGAIEVANMSLGGSGYSTAEYQAIQGAVNKGVAFAVAAGNSNDDADNYSPAAFDNVLTVSALADFDGESGALVTDSSPYCRDDQDDTLADFSNWGPEVDIAAPGVCILSTYPIERGGYGTISGTSMASPHAAGALALLASANNPADAADVYALYDAVEAVGNFDWTDDSGDGIKEPLLDVSNETVFAPGPGGGGGGGDINLPPTASFTHTCPELTCSFTDTSTDSDGSVVGWNWNLGDGGTSTAQNPPSHTYAAAGTYTVTLTVTDNDGATGTISQQVAVTAPSSGTITTSSFNNGKTWTAVVTLKDSPGSELSGTWTGGGTAFCTILDGSDSCFVSLDKIAKKTSSVTFTTAGGDIFIIPKP